MDIRWKVTDPLGNGVFLGAENFRDHIIGRHADKDAEMRAKIEPQAKFAVEHPRFVIRDVQHDSGRIKYLSLASVLVGDKIHIRTIAVIVEGNEIVTWFARRTISDVVDEKEVLYNERYDKLSLRR